MTLPSTDRITSLLSSFLDVQSRRAEVVAGNVANADTPGFAAKELDFADHLRRAAGDALAPRKAGDQATSFTEHLRVVEQTPSAIGIDGNTVDVQREMSTLADANMRFLTGTQLLQSRMRTLRTAIREGR